MSDRNTTDRSCYRLESGLSSRCKALALGRILRTTGCAIVGRMTSSKQVSSHKTPLQVGMLLYPNMTLLDLAGPQSALGFYSTTYLLSETLDPVLTDSGVTILPTTTFAACPENLDVLFVPGGFGTNDAVQNKAVVAFLAQHGPRARYVTSVCSGSILLAAAGLLDGYKAATHWALYDQLVATGDVQPVYARVVVDRNRMTGGGVTAGIDFGLSLLAELRGENVAKVQQLMMEYDPAPPYNTGSPNLAGPELTAMAIAAMQPNIEEGLAISRAHHRQRAVAAA